MIEGIPNNKIAFIILAGFSSTNRPVLGMQKKLIDMGYSAIALPFWGANKEVDTSKITAEQCHANISNAISKLAQNHDIVIGVGVSLGGAFLIEHAKTNSNLDYIVSIGTPFKLRNRNAISFGIAFYPILNIFWKLAQKMSSRTLHPIGALKFIRSYLEGDFLKNFEKVTTPILFLQSRNDFVVNATMIEKFMPQFGSEQKKIIYFEDTDHVIGYNNEVIINSVANFTYFVTELSKKNK